MEHNEIKEKAHNLDESMARQNQLLHDIKRASMRSEKWSTSSMF